MQTLEWSAAAAGTVSAALWWISTWKCISITQTSTIDEKLGDDGDIALKTEPNMFVIYRWGRVARLNAAAAFFAGLAILLQSVSTFLR